MLKTPQSTEAAFNQLREALKAEIAELQAEGQHRFHVDGVPRAARPLLQDAVHRSRILEEVERLHLQWHRELSMPPPAPLAGHAPVSPTEKTNAVLIRYIEGVSVPEAAKCLGMSEAKVKVLLEEGSLKGFRPTGGRWKIPRAEILAFNRRPRTGGGG